jgi:chromate transport protein ChrA
LDGGGIRPQTLVPLAVYFFKLGTIGFDGPRSADGFMRDPVERRRWVSEEPMVWHSLSRRLCPAG